MMRQLKLPFYLAFQYIRRGRKWTLALTIILLTVAFINLIFIPSLFTGLIEGANKQIVNTLTSDVFVATLDGEDYINGKNEIIDKLNTIDEITGTSARTLVPARMKYKNIASSSQILAVKPSDESDVSNISKNVVSGKYLDDNDTNQILLGIQVAGGKGVENNALSFRGAKVGEKVTLFFDGRPIEFTIKGIFNTKFVESDKRAFITRKSFDQIIPQLSDEATTINIKTKTDNNLDHVIKSIRDKKIAGKVYSWTEAAGFMESVSQSFVGINILLSSTGVLIAAIMILIIIYITVINKRKEIGILRAIGIKPNIIIASYVLLSAAYSITGIIVGSMIFSFIIIPYFIANPIELPVCTSSLSLSPTDYFVRLELVFWVSIVAGFIPALIVTRTKMLDAILDK